MYIWNVDPTISNHRTTSCKVQDAANMLVTDSVDRFFTETEDHRPTHVETQRTIASALQVLQETTLNRHFKAIVETNNIWFLETTIQKTTKAVRTVIYYAVIISLRPVRFLNQNQLFHRYQGR